ncbi:MAG: DUF4386 domain-containing protein [Anaerolineae bacterium]|nr:DUF4386 domain-containing protein [Anaerolineae bacterium]
MNIYRKNAIIVGVLYILGTISGILSRVFMGPMLSAQDSLVRVSAHENQIIPGALFVLMMGLALAMIPVMAFPVLRKHNETLALGYVVFRGGLEAVTYMAMAVSWLLLLPLSQAYQAGTPAAAKFQVLGKSLLEMHEIGSVSGIVFCLGALMFYYVLYQSKLIPRWLSGWGLIAIILNLAAVLFTIFNLIGISSAVSFVLQFPTFVQEMVLAVWLIVKGFNLSAIVAEEVLA